MKTIMIYNNSTHSIENYPRVTLPTFSITIGTMEIVMEYMSGKIVYIQGFLPLVKAQRIEIELPLAQTGDFFFRDIDMTTIRKFGVYELSELLPASETYFSESGVLFDQERGIIRIGGELTADDRLVRINDNIIVGIDNRLAMKCLYIMPDRFM